MAAVITLDMRLVGVAWGPVVIPVDVIGLARVGVIALVAVVVDVVVAVLVAEVAVIVGAAVELRVLLVSRPSSCGICLKHNLAVASSPSP